MTATPAEILQRIWSLSEGAYVFVPFMRGGRWNEGEAFQVEKLHGPDWFADFNPVVDNYFTPLKFWETKRRRDHVGNPGVIFADVDEGARLENFARPHLLVASSDTHQHAYWFLDRPYELEEWESKARGLSILINADPAGWDATQVLRIPGSTNHKYDPAHKVEVLEYYPGATRFRLSDFPTAPTVSWANPETKLPVDDFSEPTTEELAQRADILRTVWHGLSLEIQYFLTLDSRRNITDRSAVIWRVGGALLEAGLSPEQVFSIINPMPWNKFRGRPEQLMAGLFKQSLWLDSEHA